MPNLKLTNLLSYKNYYENIALKHKQIDGFKWGDKDLVKHDNRSSVVKRFLWAQPYDGATYEDRHSDNIHKVKVARVAYMIVPDSKLHSDEDEAFIFCESVIEDILARQLVDKRGTMVDDEWEMIITDIATWRTGPVEKTLGTTKYIGWELTMTYRDNTNLAYDPSKWDS